MTQPQPSSNQLDTKAQAWSALFAEPMSELVKRYTASVFFDKRLAAADIQGSLAHAGMLATQGIIAAQDLADIQRGLAQIQGEIANGSFEWKLDLEDVHLNIEARLTALVGDAGKRLHTGRSRNDQVATDIRLWLRGEIDAISGLLRELQAALVQVASAHTQTIMPGFTHLQVAQPVSFGHHLLAYVEMFARDEERLGDVRRRVNRLWLRGEIDAISGLLRELQAALVQVASAHTQTIMPGFTHLQVAQPVSFGHHLLAYVEMFARDEERLGDVRRRVNRLPLGSAALAGTTYPLDRELVASTLGMEGVCQNSLDAVSDRDFAIEFTAAASLIMVHISRLSEELIVWMSQNFAFIRIADRFTTGSSIMPQKKNPDVPELARGKTGRVVGHLMGLITLMKGQPLAYNKDNQEDKEPLFDTVDTLKDTLRIFAEMIGGQADGSGQKTGGITVNAANMRAAAFKGYATATDLADYLVKKGLPFRDAHEVVAHAVKTALNKGVDLSELSLAELQAFDARIAADVAEPLSLEGSLNARNTLGGTAPAQVQAQIARHQVRLAGRLAG